MFDILFNTFTYLLIIAIGYLLKKIKLVGPGAAETCMALVLNLTLPCLLINSSAGVALSAGMLVYLALGVIVNLISLLANFLVNRKKETPLMTAVTMLSGSGIDVGDFVLPFIKTFFPGTGLMDLVIFNIGNTVMNSGGNYAIAAKVSASGRKFGIKDILKKLFSSVAFDAYLLIIFMAVTGLPWPERFLQVTGVIGDANIFLVMIMIGLKLEFHVEKEERPIMLKILSVRFAIAFLMTIVTLLLPIPTLAKVVLTAAYFGPPSSTANVFSRNLGYKDSLVSQVNVICIFTAMAIITAIMMVGQNLAY